MLKWQQISLWKIINVSDLLLLVKDMDLAGKILGFKSWQSHYKVEYLFKQII